MNKLLTRQIKRHFGSLENLPVELDGIFAAINDTYESFEDDSKLLQNSIEISSQEFRNAYEKHKQDAETQKETFSKIKEVLSALKLNSQNEIIEVDENASDSRDLFDSLIRLIEERKLADEALQESETRFRHMSDNAPVLIWKAGTDATYDYFNQTWLDFTGRTLEQEMGNGWAEGVHPHDFQSCLDTYLDSFKERRKFTMEYRLMHADGKYRWLLDKGVPRYTSQGIFTGYIGTCTDITENKRVEETLRNLSRAVDQSPVSILITDTKGIIEYGNPKVFELAGYEPEELLGRHIRIFSSGEKTQEDYKQLWETILSGKEWKGEFHNKKKNGDLYWESESISAIKNTDGRIVNFLAVKEDITERKQAEKALKQSETLLRSVMDTTSDVIFVKDLECRFVYINPAGCLLNSKTQEQLVGHSKAEFVTNQEELARFMADDMRIIDTGNTETFEEEVIGADGKLNIFWTTKVPRFDGQGNIIGLIGVAHDITKRKEAEKAFLESTKKWEAIISASPDGIGMISLDGKLEFMSEKLAEMYGYPVDQKDEYMGKSIFDFIDPSNHQLLADNFHALLSGHADNKITEYLAIKKDQSRFYVDVNSTVLLDSNGNPDNILFIERDITDRKLAEAELEESREKYHGLSEASFEAIFIFENGYCIEQNQAAEKMFGYTSEEVMKKYGTEFIAPADREKVMNNMLDGQEAPYEAMALRKDGTKFPCVMQGRMMHYKGRDVRVSSISDNTSLKKIEKELIEAKEIAEESEEKFRSIIQSQAEGISIVDQNEVFEYVNVAADHIFETEENELVGTCLYDYLKPGERNKVELQSQSRSLGAVNSYELQIITKKGNEKYIQVTATPKLGENYNYLGAYGVFHDITKRKKAEDEVKRVSTRLALATLAGGVGVWEFDIISNALLWDDQMFVLYGVEKNNFAGTYQTWRSGLHPSDVIRTDAEIQMAIRGEKDFNTEFKVCWSDGSVHNLRALATVQYDDSGIPVSMTGTNWDITEQKKTEAVLLKARQDAESANNSKSVFLANMSHEIRTPLNAIIGFSQLLKRDTQLTNSQREYNISIIRAGEHLLSLINDILELSKMEAGRLELNPTNVDLIALLNDIHLIFKESAHSKHLQFIFETAADMPPYIIVDDNKLRRILVNLIGNAIKFTDEGGIAVRSRIEQTAELKNRLIFEIQDSGPGIPENEIDSLFKHFVQTSTGINKSTGSGLGLALSRELATFMGGEIKVSSEVGKGSIFTFGVEIELGKTEAVQDVNWSHVTGYDSTKETYRILVVDDIEENLQIVTNLLNMVGFETMEAVNGADAVARSETWNPHLILMDLRMPVMDGYEATRRIKSTEKGKFIPVIALTASSLEDERRVIKEHGMQGYIRKPFRESDLFGTIGNVLGIQYTYEYAAPLTLEKQFNDNWFVEGISQLPNELVVRMKNAVAAADLDLLIQHIQKIDPVHSELASNMMVLANNFDFNYLKKILNKKEI